MTPERAAIAAGTPTPISLAGKLRIALRVLLVVVVLLICLPLHYLYRIFAYGSPFPMLFLRMTAWISGARVTRIGTATFAAADFEQLEGAAEIEPRTREYFRLSQREGPARLRFVWKDVQTVDLVRCEVQIAAAPAPAPSEPVASDAPTFDGQLPIPLGLWVVAGESCESPANAGWRAYDGAGLRGASSSRCEIDAVQRQADGSVLFSQLCRASYDGSVSAVRDRITITAPRRFTLVEGAEGAGQDFNWCGSRLKP